MLAIGRELGGEESDLQLNLESWKMESTRPVLNQRDLITGGEGGGAMREGRKARKQVKCWKMERLWKLQEGKGGDDTVRLTSIRVLKTTVPQVSSRPLSWALLLAFLLHLRLLWTPVFHPQAFQLLVLVICQQ